MEKIKEGQKVIINGRGDLMMDRTRNGPFIGRPCTVIKKCKSGLYNVSLDEHPNKRQSFALINLTLLPSVSIANNS